MNIKRLTTAKVLNYNSTKKKKKTEFNERFLKREKFPFIFRFPSSGIHYKALAPRLRNFLNFLGIIFWLN
jgi:hypothetical protein